jgi:hypothetical protein
MSFRTVVDLSTGQTTQIPLTEEELAEIAAYVPPPPPPIVVSPRQIRQALTAMNLRSQVEAAVAAGDQDIKDWWEFSTQVEEDHPIVVAMAMSLSVSTEQLHQLFELASTL